MIESGTLKDRISFLSVIKGRSEFGSQDSSNWAETVKKWAKVTYNKGARAINMGEMWLPNTISVLIRYDNRINERMRFRWNGSLYRIDSLNMSKSDGSGTIVATKLDEGTDGEQTY